MKTQLAALTVTLIAGVSVGQTDAPLPASVAGRGAFRTIGEAAAAMRPGDTCVIRGGLHRETVRPAVSGEPGRPLRFVVAPGEKAVITGTEPVTGWKVYRDRIFRAEVAGAVGGVFVNGTAMTRARYPNAGSNVWAVNAVALKFATNGVMVGELPDRETNYWNGARIWGLNERQGWVASTFAVTGSVANSLLFAGKGPPWYGGGSGRGFLTGKLGELDSEGEWHHEDGILYLWMPDSSDPSTAAVEVARRQWAFDLSGLTNVAVSGMGIFAAGVNMDRSESCLLEGLRVRWPYCRDDIVGGFNRNQTLGAASEGVGIALGGSGNTVRDSVVAYSTGDGISVYGASNTVENCVVHDCNLSVSDCAPIGCTGVGHTIRRNTLFNAGRSVLVHRYLVEGSIVSNHLHHAGLLSNDLGMTYTYQTDGRGTVIAYNYIHHNLGRTPGCVGIYLDDSTKNHVVHHNVVWEVGEAMAMNPPNSTGHLVCNNTLDGSLAAIGMWWQKQEWHNMAGSRFVNNIFVKHISQKIPPDAVGTNLFKGTDAMFADSANGDYRLKPGSPAIDTGDVVAPWTGTFAGKAPDMGALESGMEPWRHGSDIPESEWMLLPEWQVLPDHRGPCFSAEKR